jgi:small subunit ribosomal protein S16
MLINERRPFATAGLAYLLTYYLKAGKLRFVMLTIRLARTGRTKYPTYRIVAAESARAATGKFVAVLGHYNPHTKDIVLKKDEIAKHLGNGAQPSNTVAKLLTREKVELPEWVKIKTKAPKPKDEPAVEEAPKAEAEAPADEAAAGETPAEEAETSKSDAE